MYPLLSCRGEGTVRVDGLLRAISGGRRPAPLVLVRHEFPVRFAVRLLFFYSGTLLFRSFF